MEQELHPRPVHGIVQTVELPAHCVETATDAWDSRWRDGVARLVDVAEDGSEQARHAVLAKDSAGEVT